MVCPLVLRVYGCSPLLPVALQVQPPSPPMTPPLQHSHSPLLHLLLLSLFLLLLFLLLLLLPLSSSSFLFPPSTSPLSTLPLLLLLLLLPPLSLLCPPRATSIISAAGNNKTKHVSARVDIVDCIYRNNKHYRNNSVWKAIWLMHLWYVRVRMPDAAAAGACSEGGRLTARTKQFSALRNCRDSALPSRQSEGSMYPTSQWEAQYDR